MINSTCGWDPHRWLTQPGGCGAWVGYQLLPIVRYLRIWPKVPHFHNGVAWCGNCFKDVRHLGQGVFVRPKEESDNVPLPKGPGLKELYG